MPDVEANRRQWDGDYAWPDGGNEWSLGWSGPDPQWHSTLLPRLRRFLPASTILEIAPGYGRWTRYLVEWCDRYTGVDLSAQGVEACRRRFEHVGHAAFHRNDGRSLAMVTDRSVDLAFSFDSLVHVEADVVESYLHELSRVLTPDGVAFLHHSNLGGCRPVARPLRLALALAEKCLSRDTGGFDQWRGATMSARRLEEMAHDAHLACIGQEMVNWLGGRLLDCISVVTPIGSKWERPNVVVRNPYFMAEAASSARAAQVHTESVSPGTWHAENAAQRLGALASIKAAAIGPWGVSVVGPWFRLRGRTRAAERNARRRVA